ncbi:hypothetical protein EV127DRAFT_30744 [Xylaria flabelliformis]|nr:hypothetical protein EV127DRAFT_30744 [Xylaria flabelliformis]
MTPSLLLNTIFQRKRLFLSLLSFKKILQKAGKCRKQGRSELSWNNDVHSPLLATALAKSTVESVPTMSAIIVPKHFHEATTTNENGGRTVAKMIDYCFTLEPTENIRRICKHEPEGLGIFNQSMDESIRYNPIAITVDTKVETAASTGEPQLAIWTKAWLNRMCQPRGFPINTDPGAPPLPLIRVRGDDWFVLFAYYESTGNPNQSQQHGDESSSTAANSLPKLLLLNELSIGSTQSIRKIYKLLQSLRLLAKWAEDDFRRHIDDVVVPDAIRIHVY